MITNWKAALAAAALSVSCFGAGAALTGAASAQTTLAPPPNTTMTAHPLRGQGWSNYNITHVRKRLERVIDSLQQDRHDYDGHREQALDFLQRAREQLLEAEQFQKQHPDTY